MVAMVGGHGRPHRLGPRWQIFDFYQQNIDLKAKFGIVRLPARIDIR